MQTDREFSDSVVEIFTEHFGIASRRQKNKGTGHYVRTRLSAVQNQIEEFLKVNLFPNSLHTSAKETLISISQQCESLLADDEQYERISNTKNGRFVNRRDQIAEEIRNSLHELYLKGEPVGKSFSQKTIREIREEKIAKDLLIANSVEPTNSDASVPEVYLIVEKDDFPEEVNLAISNLDLQVGLQEFEDPGDVDDFEEVSTSTAAYSYVRRNGKFSLEEFETPGTSVNSKLFELASEQEFIDSCEISHTPPYELSPVVRGDNEKEEEITHFQHSYWSLFDRNIEFGNEYRDFIRTIPLLSAEEESTLSKRIEAGVFAEEQLAVNNNLPKVFERELRWVARDGHRAKSRMVGGNLRLVFQIASRQPYQGLDLMDLVQEGNIGLIRAIEKFDYKLGNKFSTYATWWIRQGIQRAAADQGRIIRLPVHVMEVVKKIRNFRSTHFNSTGFLPTFELESQTLDISVSKIHEFDIYASPILSLDEEIGKSTIRLKDLLVEEEAPTTFAIAANSMFVEHLGGILDTLSWREEQIIRMRFGIDDGVPKTLDAIGASLGVTRERIRQLEKLTLEKLTHESRSATLVGYLDEDQQNLKLQTLVESAPRISDDLNHVVSISQGEATPWANTPKVQASKYIPSPRTMDDFIKLLEAAVDAGNWDAIDELENTIWELSQKDS